MSTFDQDQFDQAVQPLVKSTNALHAQMRMLREAVNYEPFKAVVPTSNLPTMISPTDVPVILTGIIPETTNATTITIQDGEDVSTQVTLTLAATALPVPLWDMPFHRGIKVISANNPATVYGKIRG